MTDPAFLSAVQLVQQIATRKIGSRELLEHYVKRLERYNPVVNAVIATDLERARRDADRADRMVASGEQLGPLQGLPMTVKESFQLAGLPTTYGLPAFRNNIATRDALAVERLRAAGAIIFGKSNVPPWLADSQSANPLYGRTNNPWDLGRSPGGSSGGAAAALAAGLTGLEVGSDIASSIRNPAHYCGVFGHKPSYGICPPLGHGLDESLAPTDIAVIGPLARGAADLALCLSVIAGPDPMQSRAWRLSLPEPPKRPLRDLRIALVIDDPVAEVDGSVQRALLDLADFLRSRGLFVSTDARPAFASSDLDEIHMSMVRAATSRRQTDEAFAAALALRSAGSTIEPAIVARTLRGNTMSHREWLALDEQRHGFRMRWERFFADWDLLLCPVASTAAFPHDSRDIPERTLQVNGREVAYADHLFWAGYAGLAYLPATVAPIGLTPDALPVGVQIVGPLYSDLATIDFARLIESEYRPFEPPSAFLD